MKFLTRNAPENFPKVFEPLFCGSEKILQKSRQTSPPQTKKTIHRRVSEGAQGEPSFSQVPEGVPETSARVHAKFGEPASPYSPEPPSRSPEFRRRSPTSTRVQVMVPSEYGWALELYPNFAPPKVHGFPVETPICHVVPISRVHPPFLGDGPNTVSESTVSNTKLSEFLALTEFRGENSVSSSQPIVCVHEQTH